MYWQSLYAVAMYHKGTPADEPHIYPMSKNNTFDGEAKIGGLE